MMKYQKSIVMLLVFVILISSIQVNVTNAQEHVEQNVSNTRLNSQKPTFGVESNKFYNQAVFDDTLSKAGNANSHWLRLNALLWSDVQPNSKNDWEWDNLSVLEADLISAREAGMEVILTVRSTPEWAQKYPGYACGPMASQYIGDFANFMNQVVQRFSVPPYSVKYYEFWNEPDEYRGWVNPNLTTPPNRQRHQVWGCWGDPDDPYFGGGYYRDMLMQVYPAVKEANENAQVVLGGLLMPTNRSMTVTATYSGTKYDYSKMTRFFEGILVNDGGNYFDYANFHGYTSYDPKYPTGILMERNEHWWASSGGQVEGKLGHIRSMLNIYNLPSKPVLITEVALADLYNRITDEDAFEAAKADYLVYVFVRNIALEVEGSTWYHIERHGWNKSGLLDTDNRPLPAYRAFQVMATTLGGAEYNKKLNLGSGIIGYEFMKNGGLIWVLFSEDGSTKSINKNIFPSTISHVYNLLGGEVNQTQTTIQFNRPIYIDDIPKTQPKFISTPTTDEVNQHEFTYYHIETASEAPAHFDNHSITAITRPNWLTLTDNLNGTATLSGIPNDEKLAEQSHHVEIQVMDSQGQIANQSFNIWVNNVNDPPQFISTPVKTAEAGEPYVYEIKAFDQDYIHGEEFLTIEAVSMPAWLGLEVIDYDESSGILRAQLTGTPTQAQIDERPTVHLRVTDKEGLFTDQIFTIGLNYIFLPLILR